MQEAMMTEISMETAHPNTSKSATSIVLAVSFWLLVSPWVYGSYQLPIAWNDWIVGAAVAILAIVRLSTADLKRTQWISGLNSLFAVWIFASPWIFKYTDSTARLINSLCVGVILFVLALWSSMAAPKAA